MNTRSLYRCQQTPNLGLNHGSNFYINKDVHSSHTRNIKFIFLIVIVEKYLSFNEEFICMYPRHRKFVTVCKWKKDVLWEGLLGAEYRKTGNFIKLVAHKGYTFMKPKWALILKEVVDDPINPSPEVVTGNGVQIISSSSLEAGQPCESRVAHFPTCAKLPKNSLCLKVGAGTSKVCPSGQERRLVRG